MTLPAMWHGTERESADLMRAIASDCTCESGVICPSHLMMMHDQKTIDRLVFYRRIEAQLVAEEWDVAA